MRAPLIQNPLAMLDRTTMYRVVLYALVVVAGTAFVLAWHDILWMSVSALAASFFTIIFSTMVAHVVCARISGAPANIESSLITAYILFLILSPSAEVSNLFMQAGIAVSAIVLKYLVVYRKRHLFNPVALALVFAGVTGYIGVEWWVGSRYLLPVVALAGLAIAIKTRRTGMVGVYLLVSTVTVAIRFFDAMPLEDILRLHYLSWPTIFFATVMLTEPLGIPSTRRRSYLFAALAGVVGSIPFSLGPLYGTPELALLVANLFTFALERPARTILAYVGRRQVGKDTYEYRFTPDYPVVFSAGQYMEWTLPHARPDNRGVRRYLSISSAPGSTEMSFAVRHVEGGSTWKRALATCKPGATLYATQRAGDFTLAPSATHHVFIAGGIGITPFMSMLREAGKNARTLPATLFYCVPETEGAAFMDELHTLAQVTGTTLIPVADVLSPSTQEAEKGPLTVSVIQRAVPAWPDAHYYISGPPRMVLTYTASLRRAGVPLRRIQTDYFPGLA